eukprot:Em0009g725a
MRLQVLYRNWYEAKARARYKADPEKKKASVRDSYKADPEKKKASVRDSYNADIESKQSAKRQRYQEDVEENRAAKRQRYQEDVEDNRAAKRQRYQEDVEENRAAKRQKYEDNSAAIKASERNRYWNDPAVRLAKRAAERKRYQPLPPKDLKSKRPRALTEEQKLDILVAYHSLQAEDAKEPLENPAQKPKGHYQLRVSALLGYSTKTVGLVYRDWHHHQQIQVAMPPPIVFLNNSAYPSRMTFSLLCVPLCERSAQVTNGSLLVTC